MITIFDDGSISIGSGSDLFNNAFDIIKYIDNYLRGEKSEVEMLVQDIHDSISIGIVDIEDTDSVTFGTIKKLAEKYK